jgi:signal transduction histidine kinase
MNEQNTYPSRKVRSATLYDPQILLAFMPPSQGHRRVALAIVLVLSVIFVVTAPFIYYPLPQVNAFIPAFDTAVFICDLITATLLVATYTVSRSRSLLVLASGYLFTALIVIPHALTFLGAFTRTDLLDARSQSTAWLYAVWHIGFALSVLGYVLLKDVDRGVAKYQGSAVSAIGSTVAIVIALVCGLTWVIIVQERYLPRVIGPDLSFIGRHGPGIGMLLVGGLVLALLWRRWHSVLDLWLMVVMFAFLFEVGRLVGGPARFSLGFYASRIYSLTTATTVLLLFLSETTTIYARLATAVMRQRHERDNRHMTMDSVVASIAHEVNQPLTAMVTNANAGLRWLTNETPNLDRARASMENIVSAGHRASEVIGSIRVMFKKGDQEKAPFDINALIRDVLALARGELQANQIAVQTTLDETLPNIRGNRVQLQQVILNLVTNAVDAMSSVTSRQRVLRLKSVNSGSDGVLVSVEDSGPGIDPKDIDRIFDSFYSTKSQGMGMGLFICRSIIEDHGGRMWATSDINHGAVFNILLPDVAAGVDN